MVGLERGEVFLSCAYDVAPSSPMANVSLEVTLGHHPTTINCILT